MTQDKMDTNNTKKFSVFFVAILVVFLTMSFVSALSLTASPNAVTISDLNSPETINISSTGNFDLTSYPSTLTITDSDSNDATFSITNTTPTTNVQSVLLDIELTSVESGFNFGTYSKSFIVQAENSTNSSDTSSVLVEVNFNKEFFEGSNEGELRISNLDFNVDGFGEDDEFWYPMDEIEVEFDVENDGDWDIENIEITTCLFDVDAEECILDEDDMDLSDDDFDLNDGDEQTITITFTLDPEELNEGGSDLTFFVSAIGTIDDNDADAFDGDETGVSKSKSNIELRNEEFIVIGDISFNPETVSCGDTIEMTAEVWNIGDQDLDDDEVFLEIRSNLLNIYEEVEFSSGIDALDFEEVRFAFEVPENAEERTYGLELIAYNDEDMDDNDVFENDEGDEARFDGLFNVEGCSLSGKVGVSANLISEAVEGEELSVLVSLTNTGTRIETYTLSASGYSSWANSVQIDTSIFALEAGETGEVTYTFDVKNDAAGVQEFSIDVVDSDGRATSQQVQVNVEPSGFLGITGAAIGSSGFLWGLGLLNIILVIIIIIVAIRVARK